MRGKTLGSFPALLCFILYQNNEMLSLCLKGGMFLIKFNRDLVSVSRSNLISNDNFTERVMKIGICSNT